MKAEMNRILRVSVLLFGISLSLCFPMPVASQSGTTVSVNPSSITLDPGETAMVEIIIDLAEGESLRAFSVEIAFDPGRISASNLTQGDFLVGLLPEPTNEIDNETGTISFGFTQGPVAPVSGSGTLFSFDIQAKDIPGQTSLEIIETELVDEDYFLIDHQVVNGIINITGEIEYPYHVYLPLVLH